MDMTDGGEAAGMISAHDLICRRAADGDRTALVEGATGRKVTWGELAAMAEGWRHAGLTGRRVGVAIGDPLAMAGAYLGALAAGVAIAPLNPDATGVERAAQARSLGLSVLVTDTPLPPGATGMEVRDTALHLVAPGTANGPDGGGAALIMSSSGTTGTPKIIPLTATQLLLTARSVVANLRLVPEDTGYSPLPLWHINGLVVGVLSAAVAGSRLVIDRRFSRRSFWSVVEREGVTWLNLVPAIITVLGGIGPPDVGVTSGVRLARSASAPLAAAVRERFETCYGIPVVETYGMTEAASQITANPLLAVRPGSVGRPAGLEIRVVDRGGRILPAGDTGGVQIRGASVTAWYWGNGTGGPRPALDADGWLATGDVGWLDSDGYLFLVGREDDVINRGGEKVQPREVEEVLLADQRVVAAAVVGRPHPTVGEEPVAYVIAVPGTDAAALVADLYARMDVSLSRFKRPATLTVVDTLPSGPTGKVSRSAVKSLAAAAAAGPW
jgi:acyl-CoA synthetase (AMP-forming)/AMP-acid ligase II